VDAAGPGGGSGGVRLPELRMPGHAPGIFFCGPHSSSRMLQAIRERVQDKALNSLSLRERVGVRGYRSIQIGH
jgi:hypothetical protein